MGNFLYSSFKQSLNLLLISISIVQLNLVYYNYFVIVQSFILPAVDNKSTIHNLTKINEKQLSFSELYPNLASLHQLLTSSIEYSSGHQYGVVSSQLTENNVDNTTIAIGQSSINQQVSDDLLTKDKSIINIKFIKKLPRKLNIKKERRKLDYLKDRNLNFDSAYLIENWNNCTVKFKSFVQSKDTGELWIHSNYELKKQNYSKKIHVKIEGFNCVRLPIEKLKIYANNITSLVIRRTGVERLGKFVFGVGSLIKLETLYLHENTKLVQLKSRAFDGLPFLTYLSIVNNDHLSELDADTFAGIKNLEELIYIGNGRRENWSYDYFSHMIKVASSRILPNLIHLHLSASKCANINEDDHEFKLMKRYFNEFFLDTNTSAYIDITRTSESKKPTNSGIKINRNDLIYIDQVKYLQLEDCQLVYLSPDAFKPLIKNLVQLNLAYNPSLSSSNLKQVLRQFFSTNLNLSAPNNFNRKHSSKLYHFQSKDDPDTYTNIGNLSYSIAISLSNNQNISMNLKSNVAFGLETLDLSGVLINLHTVPKDLFTVISKTTIKELYLKNLAWRGLSVGDLPPMPNLHTLHLDYSFIETIEENVFNTCENLVSLSFKGNLLSTIPLNMLEPLTKLERLDLSGYKSIEQDQVFYRKFTFYKKTFVYGTDLKDLNLNYKNLDLLERKIFIGLFKLENLYLKHTNLKYIEYLTFFSLKSIVKIDLSDNPLLIYNIRLSEEDTFVGLEAIEEVNFSGCNITDQDINDQNLFKRMKENMRVLDLSNNQISKINAHTFADFNELRYINLSHNQITSWQMRIFSKNNFINSLDVSHNRIKEISPEMLADFRRLKRLGFSNNPLICDCKWKGSILWLNNDNKQKKILNKLNNHEIQEQLESLVNRQQQIVTTVYASTDHLPPKSITDWLEYTTVEFVNEQHPLRSQSYYCHIKDTSDSLLNKTNLDNYINSSVSMNEFINNYCLNSLFINGSFKFTMLIVIVTSMMLLTTFCLMISLVYNSSLRNLITMVENDFIHHFEYDAFVSYNYNDSDWVLNKLVPCLEDLPNSNNNQNSKIHFSSIYRENEQYNLKTWIRNNKNKKSNQKIDQERNNQNEKNNYCIQKKGTQKCDHQPFQQNRIKLCVYERDFIAGKQISDCITESIRNSRKVILVISKNFAQSAWCRFETDLANHVLVEQNRDGLILIKLEELSSEFLEKTAPQLHFLLKTRIYLNWSKDKKEQQVFFRKLHLALGFNKANNNTYNHIRNMYQNYCTNHKPDLKRRHSVMLAPTQNELNTYNATFDKKMIENPIINNLTNSEERPKNKIFEKESVSCSKITKNLETHNLSNKLQNDQIYNTSKANNELNKMNEKTNRIQENGDRKIIKDKNIRLRNQILLNISYDNLPFYRLLFTTQNLLPDLYNKLVTMKQLVINLIFSGFSFRG